MKAIKAGLFLASFSLLSAAFVTALPRPAQADNSPLIQRILGELDLDPVRCGTLGREISVYDPNTDARVCARANNQFPPGTYLLDRQNYSIRPVGNNNNNGAANANSGSMNNGGMNNGMNNSSYVNNGGPVNNGGMNSSPFNSGGYGNTGGYGNNGGMNNGLPNNGMLVNNLSGPAILVTNNPSQYVDPGVSAQIAASVQGHGLSLASCSANPGVVVMIGPYMACAYPNQSYPPGRYVLNVR